MIDTEHVNDRKGMVPMTIEPASDILLREIEPTTPAEVGLIFIVVTLFSAGAFRYLLNAIGG